jgi:hypothetical protein
MSDQSQGPGWWRASNDKWYPPEQHPDYRAPDAPARQSAPEQTSPQQAQQSAVPSRAEARADAKAAAARAKALRPWYRKKRFMIPLVLLVIVVVAMAAGGGGDEDDGGSDSPSTAADGGDSRQGDELLAVGGTGTTSGFEVTLLTVEHPFQVGEFEPGPDSGRRLIGVELSIRNTTDERKTMSSLLGLEISDDTGQRFDITIRGVDRPQIDGEAAPGETIRGWAVFEVPDTSTGLELEVRGSLTASGIRFDLGLG